MAWVGSENLTQWSWPFQLFYWSIFMLLLLAAMYIVIIDLRYIRLQYKLEQREVFQSTLADEEFRKALRAAQMAEEDDD